MDHNLITDAVRQSASVTGLAQELVRVPSRGGIDDYEPVLGVLGGWLAARGLPRRRLNGPGGEPVGLLVEIAGSRPGPWWALDACLDTAPFGDESAWSFRPTAGDVVGGWLRGRGAADSKLAAAMFCHIAADVRDRVRAGDVKGGLAVLLDVDEHTGAFGGARAYLADPDATRPSGVMIGYPGLDEIVVGGRGLWRAHVRVHADSGHSGSRRSTTGAVTRAARLVGLLDAVDLPTAPDDAEFPLPPKLSVTAVHGGEGFSTVPGLCVVSVDIRTTPAFDAGDAETAVRKAVAELDATVPGPCPTETDTVAVWPPFRLDPRQQPATALIRAADALGTAPRAKVAGPSNIGNLLAREGIPATAGFGLHYEGLHGIDERVRLAELPLVHAIYHQAVLDLLGVE